MGRISLPNGGEWEILLGRIFYWVVGIWWGVIPAILIFFKAKNQHSVNIEYELKSKLAWLVCKKSMKLNLKMVQDQQLQPKNKVLFGLLLKNCYSVGAMNLWSLLGGIYFENYFASCSGVQMQSLTAWGFTIYNLLLHPKGFGHTGMKFLTLNH